MSGAASRRPNSRSTCSLRAMFAWRSRSYALSPLVSSSAGVAGAAAWAPGCCGSPSSRETVLDDDVASDGGTGAVVVVLAVCGGSFSEGRVADGFEKNDSFACTSRDAAAAGTDDDDDDDEAAAAGGGILPGSARLASPGCVWEQPRDVSAFPTSSSGNPPINEMWGTAPRTSRT